MYTWDKVKLNDSCLDFYYHYIFFSSNINLTTRRYCVVAKLFFKEQKNLFYFSDTHLLLLSSSFNGIYVCCLHRTTQIGFERKNARHRINQSRQSRVSVLNGFNKSGHDNGTAMITGPNIMTGGFLSWKVQNVSKSWFKYQWTWKANHDGLIWKGKQTWNELRKKPIALFQFRIIHLYWIRSAMRTWLWKGKRTWSTTVRSQFLIALILMYIYHVHNGN